MPAHPYFTAELTFLAELEDIALEPVDRSSRACRAASHIRRKWGLQHVALFDVAKGETTLVGCSGDASAGDRNGEPDVVIPVSSLTGDLIGRLEVRGGRGGRIPEGDRLRLEACAGVLWWLWAGDAAGRTPGNHVGSSPA